nr:hypothetical protein 24 [bacterium]
MATLSRGYTFAADGEVTNINLHNMVDAATITDITQNDIADNYGLLVTDIAEPVQNALWRDAGDDFTLKAYEPVSGKWKELSDSDDISTLSGSIASVSGAVGTLESSLNAAINNTYFVDHKDIALSFTDTTVSVSGHYLFVEGYRVDLSSSLTGTMPVDLDTGVAANKWYSVIVAVKDNGLEPKIVFSELKESTSLPTDYLYQRHVGYVYRNSSNIFDKAYDAFTHKFSFAGIDISSLFTSAGPNTLRSVDLSAYIPPSADSIRTYIRHTNSIAGQQFVLYTPYVSVVNDAKNIEANAMVQTAGLSATANTFWSLDSSQTAKYSFTSTSTNIKAAINGFTQKTNN